MNLVIDDLDGTTGWSASGGASIYGLNANLSYIAGENNNSIMFSFLGGYVEKSYGIDVSNYDEFIVHVWSQQKQTESFYKIADFSYKIDFGVGKEFYLPTFFGFQHFVLDISSINILDRIRVTALHGDSDYIVMSYAVVAKDHLPLDLFDGFKLGLETYRDALDTYLIGTVTGTTGDTTINLDDINFVHDYCSIKIDDGVNSEIHQLKRHAEGVFTLTDLYDGGSLLNSYTSANTYLYFPIEYGRESLEAIIPGITVWGFEPAEKLRSFNIENVLDTWTNLGASERREGYYYKWPIALDCEARHNEILAHLTKIARGFISRKRVYVNGRKMEIKFERPPIETRTTEHFDIIPKVQYHGVLELREEIWQRTSLPITTTMGIRVRIQV